MQKLSHQIYSFDGFALDLTRGCLLHEREEIKLRPKSFEALKYLVENNRRLISKDELIHAVWIDTAVTDDSLVKCLKDIRRALRDDGQQIIKTVHGRGYIFDREVKTVGSAQVTSHTEETAGVQLIIEEEDTNGHGDAGTLRRGDAGTLRRGDAGTLRRGDVILLPASQSKVRSLIAAIEQHKCRVVVGVLTIAVMIGAI